MSTQAITPRHGKVYRCRYGFHGASQLALFVGYRQSLHPMRLMA